MRTVKRCTQLKNTRQVDEVMTGPQNAVTVQSAEFEPIRIIESAETGSSYLSSWRQNKNIDSCNNWYCGKYTRVSGQINLHLSTKYTGCRANVAGKKS